MKIPIQVAFHGIEHSDALHDAIQKKAEKLDRYYNHIMSCHVVLELNGRHKRHGRQFSARPTPTLSCGRRSPTTWTEFRGIGC